MGFEDNLSPVVARGGHYTRSCQKEAANHIYSLGKSNDVMGYKSSKALNYSLRAMAGLSTALGVGFIIWGVVIQNPPETALTIGMVILGTLALCVGLLGLLISFMGRACLAILLLCSFLVALGELALTISLMVDMDKSVNALVDSTLDSYKNNAQDALDNIEPKQRRLLEVKTREELEAEFTNDLQYARYIFLILSIIECILVIFTTVVKIKHPYKDGVEGDEEDQLAAQSAMAQIQLEGLKNSVKATENGSESSTYAASKKMYKSVTRKMTQKYGEFTNDPAFQKKKWWQSIPGLG